MPQVPSDKITQTMCAFVLDMAGIKPPATRKALALVYCDGLSLSAAAEKSGTTRQNLNVPAKKFAKTKALADLYAEEKAKNNAEKPSD